MSYFACLWLITFFVVWLYEDYTNAGYLALAMNITNIFYCTSTYNIRAYQVSDIRGEYSDSEYMLARFLTCTASVVLCTIFIIVINYQGMQRSIIFCYMLFRANEAFIDVLHGIDQKHWRMDYIGISFIARGVSMLVAFIVLGWLWGFLAAVIGMLVVTSFVNLFYDLPRAKKLAKSLHFTASCLFSLLKRCFPLMLVMLISTFIVSYSRYSLERIHGTEALGIYASVIAPTVIVQLSATFIFSPLINLFASYLNEANEKSFITIFSLCCVSIFGITLIIYIASLKLSEWGLSLLFGDSIRPYAHLLSGAVIVAGLTAYMWFMNMLFSIIRDMKGILYGNVIGALICFAITDALLIKYGLAGANYTMIISQGIAVFYLFIRFFWFFKTKHNNFHCLK